MGFDRVYGSADIIFPPITTMWLSIPTCLSECDVGVYFVILIF